MMLILPVANGILPRPQGGKITGLFMVEQAKLLAEVGTGRDIMICPWVEDEQVLYPVGVIARILRMWVQPALDQAGHQLSVLMAELEGREHARWHRLRKAGSYVVAPDVEVLNFKKLRKEYPVISGAGWAPAGGYTEFRAKSDLPVTLYGSDLETGREVNITANLGGLVEQEQAHTIEHAIIRALSTYGLCTPRTLLQAIAKETSELKQSLELSLRFTLPEILGVTSSGTCGNTMTNLAQFYLAKDFIDNLEAGQSVNDSIINARRSTMSQLNQDLGLTMNEGLRVLQGLKKGMSHDDSALKIETCKKVIGRFPFEPWE